MAPTTFHHWRAVILLILALEMSAKALARASNMPFWVNTRTNQPLRSPAEIARATGSSMFNAIRLDNSINTDNEFLFNLQQNDLFECAEPTRDQYDTFVGLYNRTFDNEDSASQLDRVSLFQNTMRRTILLNRIVQSEILNRTNYDVKPEIRNYHFISPMGLRNAPLWYSDITDCELGLIKRIVFDIFYWIDRNEMATAYKLAVDNSEYLPLLNADGFEQLANVLLVRLYERFRGDEKMNQLFQWPLYLKKLAGYAYSRREAAHPDFKLKMPLVAFAYPSYFKDLKYNVQAVNRTGDNILAHEQHERFNRDFNRKFTSRQERNKRLVIFRQRWSLLNALKDEESRKFEAATYASDWEAAGSIGIDGQSARLVAEPALSEKTMSQFSDLTDAEFVAFLTNDFSLLENSKESAEFIDNNFPIRPLDHAFRDELANELYLRRIINTSTLRGEGGQSVDPQQVMAQGKQLARRVIDELIGDVGLPIGSAFETEISNEEHGTRFTQVAKFFQKPYAGSAAAISRRLQRLQENGIVGARSSSLSDSDLRDEQQRRYETFKQNYGRFKAWFKKENWLDLTENQLLPMLRLADLSWQEIKMILFKVCCLTDDNLANLSSQNATIQYLGSNEFLCQSISGLDPETANDPGAKEASDLTALELYYYYAVHFNKHHSHLADFNRRFTIFRRNIDQIRQHSCTRGLTLYYSLKLKKLDTLSTIDVLDQRRSYTDDLNLDRYDYFTVKTQDDNAGGKFARLRQNPRPSYEVIEDQSPSRAGISYNRGTAYFSNLLDQNRQLLELRGSPSIILPSYVDKLTNATQNLKMHAYKYRQNSAYKIYEIVMQRYRHCMRTVYNIDPGTNLRQQCQSTGPLADSSANILGGFPRSLARLQQSDGQSSEEGKCNFYRHGLEPWAEGLIPQNEFSSRLISSAKCENPRI